MLAIYLTDESLLYAQLVNYQGEPFIETTGQVSLREGIHPSDAGNPELRQYLSGVISQIRNAAEFPDTNAQIIVDSTWFPLVFHEVDSILTPRDLDKYLSWRGQEMLDKAMGQYDLIHQPLGVDEEGSGIPFLTIARAHGLTEWIHKIVAPSELKIDRIMLDLEAGGEVLNMAGELDGDRPVILLENRRDQFRCRVYRNREIAGVFDITASWDYRLVAERVRGDRKLLMRLIKFLTRSLKEPDHEHPAPGKILTFQAGGDKAILKNLLKNEYVNSLDVKHCFKFRDTELEAPETYAIPLGTLAQEIRERFDAD